MNVSGAAMNSDLKRRLTPYVDIGDQDRGFLQALEQRLYNEMPSECDAVKVFYQAINQEDDDTAYVTFHGDYFKVVLDHRLSFGTICDYLLHEFAHIGTWFVNEEDDHGPIFGVEWARLYRIYLEMYDYYYG